MVHARTLFVLVVAHRHVRQRGPRVSVEYVSHFDVRRVSFIGIGWALVQASKLDQGVHAALRRRWRWRGDL